MTFSIENNFLKCNIKFDINTFKTIKDLINSKQNSKNLKPKAGINTIECNKRHKIYIGATSRNSSNRIYKHEKDLLQNDTLGTLFVHRN